MKWSGMCAYTRRQEKTFSYRTASVTCALPAIGFQLIHQQIGWVNVQTGCVTAPLSKVQKSRGLPYILKRVLVLGAFSISQFLVLSREQQLTM